MATQLLKDGKWYLGMLVIAVVVLIVSNQNGNHMMALKVGENELVIDFEDNQQEVEEDLKTIINYLLEDPSNIKVVLASLEGPFEAQEKYSFVNIYDAGSIDKITHVVQAEPNHPGIEKLVQFIETMLSREIKIKVAVDQSINKGFAKDCSNKKRYSSKNVSIHKFISEEVTTITRVTPVSALIVDGVDFECRHYVNPQNDILVLVSKEDFNVLFPHGDKDIEDAQMSVAPRGYKRAPIIEPQPPQSVAYAGQ